MSGPLVAVGRMSDAERLAAVRGLGVYTPDDVRRLERLRAGRFFLLRNSGPNDDPARCGRCRAIHRYYTLFCTERPWRGDWADALYAYAKLVRDFDLGRRIVALRGVPNFARSHPRTARQWAPDAPGTDLQVIALGTVEPIPAGYAEKLADRIRGVDPAFVL